MLHVRVTGGYTGKAKSCVEKMYNSKSKFSKLCRVCWSFEGSKKTKLCSVLYLVDKLIFLLFQGK